MLLVITLMIAMILVVMCMMMTMMVVPCLDVCIAAHDSVCGTCCRG